MKTPWSIGQDNIGVHQTRPLHHLNANSHQDRNLSRLTHAQQRIMAAVNSTEVVSNRMAAAMAPSTTALNAPNLNLVTKNHQEINIPQDMEALNRAATARNKYRRPVTILTQHHLMGAQSPAPSMAIVSHNIAADRPKTTVQPLAHMSQANIQAIQELGRVNTHSHPGILVLQSQSIWFSTKPVVATLTLQLAVHRQAITSLQMADVSVASAIIIHKLILAAVYPESSKPSAT